MLNHGILQLILHHRLVVEQSQESLTTLECQTPSSARRMSVMSLGRLLEPNERPTTTQSANFRDPAAGRSRRAHRAPTRRRATSASLPKRRPPTIQLTSLAFHPTSPTL